MAAALLVYPDLAHARQVFVDALGFTETLSLVDDEGRLSRVHVQLGGTVLLLGRPGDHGLLPPVDAGAQTHLLIISVGDVDGHWAKAVAAGAPVTGPPIDQPWGREYEVVDTAGYTLAFIR